MNIPVLPQSGPTEKPSWLRDFLLLVMLGVFLTILVVGCVTIGGFLEEHVKIILR